MGAGAAPRPSPPRCATATGRPSGCARPALPQQPDRVTYLRTEITPPAGTLTASDGLRLGGAHLPALPQRPPGGRLAQLLVSRRAVRTRRGRGVGRPSPDGRTPSACCTAGTARGRAGRPRLPGCCCQLSLWYADGRHVVYGSDGSWRERPAEWLPIAPSATPTSATSWNGSTAGSSPRGGRAGIRRPHLVARHRHRPRGHPPFTATYAQRTTSPRLRSTRRLHTVAGGAVVADFGAVYAARPRVEFARGQDAHGRRCGRATCSNPTDRSRPLHGTQETNLSSSYIMRDGHPDLRGLHLLRVPLPADRRPRGALGRGQCGHRTARRHARRSLARPSPRTTACSTRYGASTHARASTAATSNSSTRRPVRRDSSSGTPPTSPRASCGPTATRT